MASLKFLLGLLAVLCSLTLALTTESYEKWAELPSCAVRCHYPASFNTENHQKTCIYFASGTGVPPAGLCSTRNITCICGEPQWRITCANCLSKGDTNGHQVEGCGDEGADNINAVLSYVSDIFCRESFALLLASCIDISSATANETKEADASYSPWSFTSVTVVATSSSTSAIPHNATTTSSSNSSIALPTTSVDGPSTHVVSTSYYSTSMSTIYASPTSATASPTSTSGATSLVYGDVLVAWLVWAIAFA